MQEAACLPLKTEIPDITQNISLSDDVSIRLTPGCYAISCYISTMMKKHGFIELTPVLNDCWQNLYTVYAEGERNADSIKILYYGSADRIHPVFCMAFFCRNFPDQHECDP